MILQNNDIIKFNRESRLADIKRWQSMDFVIGYQINLSNNPKHKCELCSRLCGIYPKMFYWKGWCAACKCFITPIFADDSIIEFNHRQELRSALYGKPFKLIPYQQIKYVPKSFIDWFLECRNNLYQENAVPYFVSKNINIIVESYEYYKNQNK